MHLNPSDHNLRKRLIVLPDYQCVGVKRHRLRGKQSPCTEDRTRPPESIWKNHRLEHSCTVGPIPDFHSPCWPRRRAVGIRDNCLHLSPPQRAAMKERHKNWRRLIAERFRDFTRDGISTSRRDYLFSYEITRRGETRRYRFNITHYESTLPIQA